MTDFFIFWTSGFFAATAVISFAISRQKARSALYALLAVVQFLVSFPHLAHADDKLTHKGGDEATPLYVRQTWPNDKNLVQPTTSSIIGGWRWVIAPRTTIQSMTDSGITVRTIIATDLESNYPTYSPAQATEETYSCESSKLVLKKKRKGHVPYYYADQVEWDK
jgi:hypothetical protein